MRRAIALMLMVLVPLQYSWAAASLHLHPGEVTAGEVMHLASHLAHSDSASPGTDGDSSPADGEHGHHCNHVPSLIIPDCTPLAGIQPSGKPAPALAGIHASHIPPVRDRPPRSAG